ncbi:MULTISPECIES: metalloprotease [Halorussus]|uniref:metalloprotease n=1 Tax=Halorussus TaxID=1070314 RepID=UPI0020A19B24|nr:metalloprotease [Halorussus vallis]USZ76298.1 metalloprotease [Halorussus vallis]
MSANIRFSGREIRDLAVAWGALGLAFGILLGGGQRLLYRPSSLVTVLPMSMVTAGLGFLLHELAHKVTAIKFGQVAEFRADYGMLFLAVVGAMAGFLFAAPGAVYHRGRATPRENGLIALAGPLTNVALGILFLPVAVLFGGLLGTAGDFGVYINFLLAGFNMIPFGPLDGNTVKDWSLTAFVAAGVPCFGLAAWMVFGGGLSVL